MTQKALKNLLKLPQKHCALGVKAEHYPLVYQAFMHAVAEVLGDAATPEVADAWGKVVLYIARAFIGREVEIYEKSSNIEDGWFGFKNFKITGKKRETDSVYTYNFSPVDGSQIPEFKSGQNVTVRLAIPNSLSATTMRHYTVTNAPGESYLSISVLCEKGIHKPDGQVSNYLRENLFIGDTIDIGMPFGLVEPQLFDANKPIVLVAGGIGITNCFAILNHFVKNEYNKIYFCHCLHDGASHPFRNEVANIALQSNGKVNSLRVYSTPRLIDMKAVDYDVGGRITMGVVKDWVKDDLLKSSYLLCAPQGLLDMMIDGLVKEGVSKNQIHFEMYGPNLTVL